MSKKKILIVCRHFNKSPLLVNIINSSEDFFIVASDDIRVHKFIKKFPNVKKTIWLKQLDSLYSVAEEVLGVIQNVNIWFKNTSNGHSSIKDIMRWPKHCEGGPSQKILNFLLLQKSYESIFKEATPDELHILKGASSDWEDNLLIEISKQKKIPVRILSGNFIGLAVNSIYQILYSIRPYLVGGYRVLNVIQAKLRYTMNRNSGLSEGFGQVAIQLVSDNSNHQNYTKTLTKSLEESGLNTVILGWHLGSSANKLLSEGFNITELERWVKIQDILLAIYQVAFSRFKASREINKFNARNTSAVKKSFFQKTLNNFVLDFYFNVLLDSALLKRACINYFRRNKPLALRTHSIALREAAIIYNASKENGIHPLIFFQSSWPYNISEPISDEPIPRENILVFAIGKLNKQILISQGFLKENIFLNGIRWLPNIKKYALSTSKNIARKKMRIPPYDLVILLDSNSTLDGYQTPQEQQLVLIAMLDFVKENINCYLLVKPHPVSPDVSLIEQLVHEYNLNNVEIVEKSVLAYDAIRASDLLITKISTLALEAMYLSVPTLGIVLDNELEWEVYGEAVDYCHSILDLQSRLKKLSDNPLFLHEWKKLMNDKKFDFFKAHGILDQDNQLRDLSSTLKSRIFENKIPRH